MNPPSEVTVPSELRDPLSELVSEPPLDTAEGGAVTEVVMVVLTLSDLMPSLSQETYMSTVNMLYPRELMRESRTSVGPALCPCTSMSLSLPCMKALNIAETASKPL